MSGRRGQPWCLFQRTHNQFVSYSRTYIVVVRKTGDQCGTVACRKWDRRWQAINKSGKEIGESEPTRFAAAQNLGMAAIEQR